MLLLLLLPNILLRSMKSYLIPCSISPIPHWLSTVSRNASCTPQTCIRLQTWLITYRPSLITVSWQPCDEYLVHSNPHKWSILSVPQCTENIHSVKRVQRTEKRRRVMKSWEESLNSGTDCLPLWRAHMLFLFETTLRLCLKCIWLWRGWDKKSWTSFNWIYLCFCYFIEGSNSCKMHRICIVLRTGNRNLA